MKPDPLVAALALAIEGVIDRGVTVTLREDGWLIRLAPVDRLTEVDLLPDAPPAARSW
jgi:hypothetical protein